MAYHVFRSPSRYIQGVGAIDALGKEAAVYGKKAFLLTDDFVWGLLQEKVERALEGFPIIMKHSLAKPRWKQW